jgi:hypothetical protein
LLLCSALKICFLTHTGRHFVATQYSLPADASYRLTQEKNGLYPVITTNLAMESKTIAYRIILSHEHHKAQRFILASIKAEVERIVKISNREWRCYSVAPRANGLGIVKSRCTFYE